MSKLAPLSLPFALCIWIAASGCPPQLSPDELVLYQSGCARQERPGYDQCRERRSETIRLCYEACTSVYPYICDCDQLDNCARLHPTECVETGHTFVLSRIPDPELGAACRSYFDHLRACGDEVPGDPCATFERSERHGVRDAYDCLSRRPCGADAAECLPAPDQHLTAWVCSVFRCDVAMIALLDQHDGWLRDEVVDAVWECEAWTGPERERCVRAWLAAITP